MINDNKLKFFLNLAKENKICESVSGLKFYLENLYSEVNFEGKNVLDIGAGSGLHSFYAACRGAAKVVSLEPQADGSSTDFIEKFKIFQNKLGFANVLLHNLTFQEFIARHNGEKFDVIILHNSINHLDENACINLLWDEKSTKVYRKIFNNFSFLANLKATILIADCSRHNFFSFLGIKNPFTPSIQWHKHQSPKIWAELLRRSGFSNLKIRWLSPHHARRWGILLLENKIASYFINSHFLITAEKK